MNSFEIKINPKVLHFAIKSSGHSPESIISRLNTKSFNLNYLNNLLKGETNPTITDIEKLDKVLKRGVPFFFLNEVPNEEKFLKYRKKIPHLDLEPKTEVTLREFNFLREEIKYMLEENNIDFNRKIEIYKRSNNAKNVAKNFRELFEFDKLELEKLKPVDVFKIIREKIESCNIFVFKNIANSEKLDENLRGCIFLENDLPPLILINSNENKFAEIFSLLHEFAHYLLNKEEIDTDEVSDDYNNPTERWCNEFAYRFLITEEIEEKEHFNKNNTKNLLKKDNLENLSRKYKISKAALMYRFLLTNIISLEDYRDFKLKYVYKEKSPKDKKSSSDGNYYNTIRDKLSKRYISLVTRSYKNNSISMNEAFNYLKIKDSSKIDYMEEVTKE